MTPGASSNPVGVDDDGTALKEFVERVPVTLNDAGEAAGWVSKEIVDHLWLDADGELVSQLWVVDVTVRAWGEELRSAGVAGVGTPEPHRMKGYARRLMEMCERYAAERGYAISTLFGIPDFYHRFGYATVCPEYEIRIELDALETDGPTASLEDIQTSDWDAIARVCNAAYGSLDGSVVRSEGAWRGPRQGSDWFRKTQALVSRDARGRPAAYAVVDTELTDDCLVVSEAVAGDNAAGLALAGGLAEVARARGATGLLACLPPDTGLGPLLTRCGGTPVVTRPDNAGYMACIVDLGAVLERRTPTLTAQAAASDLPVPEVLHVKTDIGDGRFALGGSAPPAELSIDRLGLVQLLFGYRTFSELRDMGQARATGAADDVLAGLFPRNDGYCFWPDRY
ncbi:MAG: GNAT family N-acetyltransferase [Chloroflexi bacterium]|nr:GNAT family N-acetyltransferase [Chloroflexota bacterium]